MSDAENIYWGTSIPAKNWYDIHVNGERSRTVDERVEPRGLADTSGWRQPETLASEPALRFVLIKAW